MKLLIVFKLTVLFFLSSFATAQDVPQVSYIRSLSDSEQKIIRVTTARDEKYRFELCTVGPDQRCIPLGKKPAGYSVSEMASHSSYLRLKGVGRLAIDVGVIAAGVVSGGVVGGLLGGRAGRGGVEVGAGIGMLFGSFGGAIIGGGASFVSVFAVDSLNPFAPWKLVGKMSEKDLRTLRVTNVVIDSGIIEYAADLDLFLSGIDE